ncbi:MAG: SPOR domain-containing protein [Gemmatimonadota bacterium]
MKSRPSSVGLGLLLAALACRNAPKQLASGLSVASLAAPSSLLRFPSAGGIAQIYRDPSLVESGWKSQGPLPPVRRVLGADLDQDVVYAFGAKNEIMTLDLQTGKVRQNLLGKVRDAAIGPDGTLFTVDDSNVVTQVVHRNPIRFQARLPGAPSDLFGTKDDRMVAIASGAGNAITQVGTAEQATTIMLPRGDAAATFWGDLIAVAADTAVILFEPQVKSKPQSIAVSGHARAVMFSPSGHRLYVARRDAPVLILNRFTGEELGQLTLPGPAGSMRADPFGRWMLVHPSAADSVWVVDLATRKLVGSFATEWGADLPTVTDQQTLVLRHGDDVVGYDLTKPELPRTGVVTGGGHDFWAALAWTPETGTSVPTSVVAAADTTPADSGTGAAARPAPVYLQISSSQNPTWADELAKQLAGAGLPASVLKPGAPDEGYRVVLGPYATREEAEASGRKLGRPFFIYQPDRSTDH